MSDGGEAVAAAVTMGAADPQGQPALVNPVGHGGSSLGCGSILLRALRFRARDLCSRSGLVEKSVRSEIIAIRIRQRS